MKKIYFSVLTTLFALLLNLNAVKAAGPFFLIPGGNITNEADWGLNTNGTGTHPTFSVNNTYSFTGANNAALSLSTTWSITSSSILGFGNGTQAFSFTLASGGVIGDAGAPKVVFNNLSTIVLTTTVNFGFVSSKTVFNSGSTVIYGSGSDNPIPSFADHYHHLIIAASNLNQGSIVVDGNMTLSAPYDLNASQLTVSGNFIMNGNLTTNQGVFALGGTISGTSTIIGDNASSIDLTGSGNVGTLNFASGFETLNTFNVNLGTSTSSVTLGGDLFIDGGSCNLQAGILNLNSFQLNIMSAGSVDFSGGGEIAGHPSSSLVFEGGITGSMLMNSAHDTLAYVHLKSSGNTLTLGNQLYILDSISPNIGTLDMGANNLRLVSSSQLKGRLGYVGGSVTGTMTVETFIPSGVTGWGQIGISGVQGQKVSDWEDDIPMTCVGCPYGATATGVYFVSINSYTEATEYYDTTIAYTTALPPGQGFWVFLGNSASGTSGPALTLVNTGAAVSGTVAAPMTAISSGTNAGGANVGWNLVANPYASPIDADLVFSSNSSVLDDPSFYSWSAANSSAEYNTNSQIGTNGFNNNGEIAMGQGFYVKCFGASNNLVFNESMKCFNSNNPEVIKRPINTSQTKHFKLRINGTYLDTNEMAICIHPDATMGFDKYDSKKKFTSPGYAGYPGTYSAYTTISGKDAQGVDYAIQTMPSLSQSVTIPILAHAMVTGQYTITAKHFDDIENCLLLRDRVSGAIHDLKSGPLVVTLSDTTSVPRFDLMMCRDANPVGIAELKASNNVFINQDAEGAFVRTSFDEPTKATISAYNIIGQQLMNDVVVEGTTNTTRLNLGVHSQVVVIKVSTGNESVVKKIVAH